MENNCQIPSQPQGFKAFLKSWRFWRPFLSLVGGGVAGFLYYFYVGCESGSCAITSSPYMSIIWGALLGWFVFNSPCSRGRC